MKDIIGFLKVFEDIEIEIVEDSLEFITMSADGHEVKGKIKLEREDDEKKIYRTKIEYKGNIFIVNDEIYPNLINSLASSSPDNLRSFLCSTKYEKQYI